MRELPWTRRVVSPWAVVTVAGEIDIADAQDFTDELLGALDGGQDLAVDASGVSFIDSSGLGALLSALRRSGEVGRRFVVVPSSAVSRVMDLTGTLSAFTLATSLDDLLAAG
jgi:anti-sigma B factor antagonist